MKKRGETKSQERSGRSMLPNRAEKPKRVSFEEM